VALISPPDLPELPPGATMPPRFDRLVEYLAHNAATRPGAEALVDGRERLGWRAALARSDGYAAALLGAGVCPGDRVAVWSVPRIDALLLYFACMRMGAVFVALDPRHSIEEAAFILGDAEPAILFHIRAFEGRDYVADVRSLNRGFPTFALDAGPGPAFDSSSRRGTTQRRSRCAPRRANHPIRWRWSTPRATLGGRRACRSPSTAWRTTTGGS